MVDYGTPDSADWYERWIATVPRCTRCRLILGAGEDRRYYTDDKHEPYCLACADPTRRETTPRQRQPAH